MITCHQCGRENEDHYKFCLGCGAALQAPPKQEKKATSDWPSDCPQCGAGLQAGQRFCGSCGFNVGAHVEAAAAEAPAEESPGAGTDASAAPPAETARPAEPVENETSGRAAERAGSAAASRDTAGSAGGAPSASSAQAQLILLNPDGSPGGAIPLAAGTSTLGRSTDIPFLQRDEYLSPSHLRIDVQGGSAVVHDEGGANGIFLRITEPVALKHGDEIRIGRERLRFVDLAQARPVLTPANAGTRVLGSPLAGAWGRLERISGPAEASIVFLLRADEHKLGRERGDILFPDDGYVSGAHARVFRDPRGFWLEDLRSSNGTFIRLREPTSIGTNALLLLGEQPFRFVAGGQA